MMKVLRATLVLITICAMSLAQVNSRSTAPANLNAASESAGDYSIGAGDVLRINVWHEPDFEIQSTPVRPDGKVTVNLLRDVQAAGLTPTQLGDLIEKGLRERIRHQCEGYGICTGSPQSVGNDPG